MCYFITAILSPNAEVAAVEQIAKSYDRRWEEITENGLKPRLRSGERYYFTSRSCDCSTGVGRLAPDPDYQEPDYSRQVARFRKKGWSEAKIRRWLDEKLAQRATEEDVVSRPPDDIIKWRAFIDEVLTSESADYIGLLLHWYDGLIESEAIVLGKRHWNRHSQLSEEYLLRAEADALHIFRRDVRS
jgi:hypothetical protein